MKLPFDLGLKLFFRMLIPGFFLTLGLLPFLYNLWDWANWKIPIEYTLIITVILMGWLIASLDMFVYMLYEGRRYWPRPLYALFLHIEERRLNEILNEQRKFEKIDKQKYLEATVEKRKFPLSQNGQPKAIFPTRLGNTITAYESYPDSRYGIDPVFYWYRIWLGLDKDLKEEIDNRSALADSAVYSSFALFVSSLLWLVYAILSSSAVKTLSYLPRPAIAWSFFLFLILIGYVTYRISVFIHNQFGEVFKSVYDLHLKDIDVDQVIEEISNLINDPSLIKANRREKLTVAWRYLQNFRVKCSACGQNVLIPEFEQHKADLHKTADAATAAAINSGAEDLQIEKNKREIATEELTTQELVSTESDAKEPIKTS